VVQKLGSAADRLFEEAEKKGILDEFQKKVEQEQKLKSAILKNLLPIPSINDTIKRLEESNDKVDKHYLKVLRKPQVKPDPSTLSLFPRGLNKIYLGMEDEEFIKIFPKSKHIQDNSFKKLGLGLFIPALFKQNNKNAWSEITYYFLKKGLIDVSFYSKEMTVTKQDELLNQYISKLGKPDSIKFQKVESIHKDNRIVAFFWNKTNQYQVMLLSRQIPIDSKDYDKFSVILRITASGYEDIDYPPRYVLKQKEQNLNAPEISKFFPSLETK